MTPKEVLEYAKKNHAVMVDLRFIDWPGTWQHCSYPIEFIDESTFEDGQGFDGSSIRGWQSIHESDMLMVPDPTTAFIDPFFQHPTLVMLCNIEDPITRERYSRDPRFIAHKAETYLKQSGIGDTAYFGPEAEFFIFDDARFSTGPDHSFYSVDSVEAAWNTGRDEEGGNLAYKPRHKEGYFPVPPSDSLQDIRTEMVLEMQKLGIAVEAHHHEVATGGQCEIDMRFCPLVAMADQLMTYKYVVKNVARRHGLTATFMPKPLFDDARFSTGPDHGFYSVDSVEGSWNTGRDEEGGNLAYKPRAQQGYFPVPPMDSQQDLRSEMVLEMQKLGIAVEAQHHEVATAGQAEIDMVFDSLSSMADKLCKYKYIVKQVARANGKTATFMPKPVFEGNGSGMHCHQSIWKDGKPLFAGDGYAGFSELGLHYIGGILKHSRSLAALTNPTTNSFKRLTPGYEAPVKLALSSRNRSAACRIPMYSQSPKAKRVEVRYPDPACNPYLAFSAMLMAGIDGIENKIDPGEPLDKNIYGLSPEETANIPSMPGSLEEALDCFEEDHDFLLKGDVFTQDAISAWLEYKREEECDQIRLRPHPHEFELYFDI